MQSYGSSPSAGSAGGDDPTILASVRKLARLAARRVILVGVPTEACQSPSALAARLSAIGMSTGDVRYQEIARHLQGLFKQAKVGWVVHDGVSPLSIDFLRTIFSTCRVLIARASAIEQLTTQPPAGLSLRVFDG